MKPGCCQHAHGHPRDGPWHENSFQCSRYARRRPNKAAFSFAANSSFNSFATRVSAKAGRGAGRRRGRDVWDGEDHWRREVPHGDCGRGRLLQAQVVSVRPRSPTTPQRRQSSRLSPRRPLPSLSSGRVGDRTVGEADVSGHKCRILYPRSPIGEGGTICLTEISVRLVPRDRGIMRHCGRESACRGDFHPFRQGSENGI